MALNFVDLNYKPKDDLICLFRVGPAMGLSIKEAANTVALESSTGTWTDVKSTPNVRKISAKVFHIKGNFVKIAYPSALFEKGNAPNILSSIAGNIFGMKAVKNLRLEDIAIPKSILLGFKGPKFGIKNIRKRMKVFKRPLVGTIVKPKLGLLTNEHAQSAYESWLGGCDIVKDDENLASQKFNEFEKRLAKTLEMADKAEKETGEKKGYMVNVTAEAEEMVTRAELVEKQGGKYAMVDIITVGWSALQTLRQANFNLILHAHRAMHAAFTRNKKHGISMMTIADVARLIGVDQIHIGTGIGKLEGGIKDIEEINEEVEMKHVKETKDRLEQKWGKIKPVLSVCSGGLHPGHVPFLVKHLGKDIVIQMGGGIHWNPRGSLYGARAARQAVNAVMKGISLKEYAKTNLELKEALDKFGYPKE
jgi:ribulose-bisphosphate carboxylase large chain